MPPTLFGSVESKGLSDPVSLLFATLARASGSIDSKGLTRATCLQERNWLMPDDSEGVRRTARRTLIGGEARKNCADSRSSIIAYRYCLSNDYL
jgi:hypothetical protein